MQQVILTVTDTKTKSVPVSCSHLVITVGRNTVYKFDVCVTVHHWYNNINSQLDAIIKILLFDVCVTVHHWYNNINSQLDAIIIILLFDVCVTVHHWYNNINRQLDAIIKILLFDVCVTVHHWYNNINSPRFNNDNFINNFNQLNMFREIISPILRSTRLCLQLVV